MRRLALLIAAAGLFASPAFAQSTYPTVSGPRVNGVVPLQCDVNGANCAPIASANPAPTGTGTAATQVQGTAAHDAPFVGNPIGNGCYASSTAPTAVQAGDVARGWCGLAGNGVVSIASASGSSIVYASGYSASINTSQNALATFAGLYAYDGSNVARLNTVSAAAGTGVDALAVAISPCSAATCGVTPGATSAAASSIVAKASAGNVYRVSITTGGTAGYLMGFNAISAPADGAVTPAMCRVVAANATLTTSYADMPAYWSTGITFVFSSTGCFTKTASATAFIEYSVK